MYFIFSRVIQTLQANKSGDMTVKIETDTAQVATYFTGLQDASITGREIHRVEGVKTSLKI